LAKRERWLVLNKADMLTQEQILQIKLQIIEKLNWQNKVFIISAHERQGTDALSYAVMQYLEQHFLALKEDSLYAENMQSLDLKIEQEARERLQWLDQQRKANKNSYQDNDQNNEDDPEVFYVNY